VICDLEEDGDVDIVVGAWDRQIHVWDMPFGYDQLYIPWPTFRGVMNRDGVYRPRTMTDVPQEVVPRSLQVSAPYPNPFNPSTTIRLYLPGAAGSRQLLDVSIYDVQGRRVRTLHDGVMEPGWQTWVWDGQNDAGRAQASGLYFLRARSGSESVVKKMSLIK
jgi:hypothetical protein